MNHDNLVAGGARNESSGGDASHAAKKTVLLVDVHAHSRDSRARALESLGVSVHCASGAAGARLKLQSGAYNLVLVDLGRDVDGAESLVQEIRRKYPRQLVAFLVGSPLFASTSLKGRSARPAPAIPVATAEAASAPPKGFDFGQKIKEAEAAKAEEVV